MANEHSEANAERYQVGDRVIVTSGPKGDGALRVPEAFWGMVEEVSPAPDGQQQVGVRRVGGPLYLLRSSEVERARCEVWVIDEGEQEPRFYCSVPDEVQAQAVIDEELHPRDDFHGRPRRWAAYRWDGHSFERASAGAAATDPEDLRSFSRAEVGS
jgi:hypothetical protein